jgi:hypothetical protein
LRPENGQVNQLMGRIFDTNIVVQDVFDNGFIAM